jgi:hypothetical protein
MSEPKLELDSILDSNSVQRPFKALTIARYALLDLVESPFLGKAKFSVMTVIPSWYVMTAEISDLKKYNSKNVDKLMEAAVEAADTIEDVNFLTDFTKKFLEYMAEVNKVGPDESGDSKMKTKGKKAQTAS